MTPADLAAIAAAIGELVRAEVARQLSAARAAPALELLTTAEAGAHARVSPATIRRWIRDDKLTEHRAGREVRVSRADLDALLRSGRRAPAPRERTPEELARARFGVG